MNIECPYCYASFYTAQIFRPGDKIECPNCGQEIEINEEDLDGAY